ncbi:MAG TPA: hypothetical protein VIK55_21195 [Paludibacter sp.]
MEFICTNCGHINDNETFICENCKTQIVEEDYLNILEYAKRAVSFGYNYRTEYERQVFKTGEVSIKYSLLDPNTWYEWLAMASISGLIGTYATDLVKYVAKQILDLFKDKAKKRKLTEEEQEAVNFLSDNSKLNQFTIYINNYYNGLPKIDKRVEEAIIEEEIAHVVSEHMQGNLTEYLKNFKLDDKSQNGELFLEIARMVGQKRQEKPNLETTRELFKDLKHDLIKKKRKK